MQEPFVIDFRPYTRDPNEGRPQRLRRASGRRYPRSRMSAANVEKEAAKRYLNRVGRRQRQDRMIAHGVGVC